MRPDELADGGDPRAGLTLLTVQVGLKQWQGHMRRGAQLPSEDEYAAALALVPVLPHPAAYLARTLRGLADLYSAQGRLEEAAGLFARIAEGRGKKSEVFWGDYTGLLFKLALKRIGAGQAAAANATLAQAAELLRGPADLPGAWAAAWEGYAETALWFERAGEEIPAGLYTEHALSSAEKLGRLPSAVSWLRKMASTGQQRAGAPRALVYLERLRSLGGAADEGALAQAVATAVSLAQAEWALGRGPGATEIFSTVESWLRADGRESPALADLHLAWGLALGPQNGKAHLELALQLRRRLLPPGSVRIREAEQALNGIAAGPVAPGDGTPRTWDGGAQFGGELPGTGWDAEVRRLHRKLARLCHPDAAGPAAVWSHEMTVRVNQAAQDGDLGALRGLFRETLARLAEDRRVFGGGPQGSVGESVQDCGPEPE